MIDPAGAAVRLGHSIAFFIGTAYGSTETAERLAKSVRAMHHTIKGIRPDGARYDADDPDWLRWNYATVVWGLATAHELYHPQPLRGKKIDRYYGEFVRVGHALGGTDLPTTKAETLDCLQSYLPKLALTHGMAMSTGPGLPMTQSAVDWAIRDTLPKWAAQLVAHTNPNIVERTARRAAVWAVINGLERRHRPHPRVPSGAGPGEGRHDGAAHAAHDVRARHRPGAQPRRGRAHLRRGLKPAKRHSSSKSTSRDLLEFSSAPMCSVTGSTRFRGSPPILRDCLL